MFEQQVFHSYCHESKIEFRPYCYYVMIFDDSIHLGTELGTIIGLLLTRPSALHVMSSFSNFVILKMDAGWDPFLFHFR